MSTTQLLTGWGRTAPTRAEVVTPTSAEETVAALKASGDRGIAARGLGRCYGDAAQCAGGTVVDSRGLDGILETNLETGVVRVGGGLSLDALMRTMIPKGWWVPVTPGTRYVTVGGAVAADIHGKNHHVDGSFCRHVDALTLATPTGVHDVGPDRDRELFWATAGGMGLTGVVVDATVRMIPIETAWMRVDTDRCPDLDDVLSRMESGDDEYRYSVAWIDCLKQGAGLGRSVLTRGDHAGLADLPSGDRGRALDFGPKIRLTAPPVFPSGLVNSLTVRAFNELWFRKAPRHEVGKLHSISGFFHPLDGVGGWNHLYGRRGFVQYQFVVPFDRTDVVRTAVQRLSGAQLGSSLAVLKRFGAGSPGPLSFPMEGWTLTLDLPVGPADLGPVLDGLDELVADSGGRIYFAKDSRLEARYVPRMYPRLEEWRAIRDRVDPERTLTSDLAQRLRLVAP